MSIKVDRFDTAVTGEEGVLIEETRSCLNNRVRHESDDFLQNVTFLQFVVQKRLSFPRW